MQNTSFELQESSQNQSLHREEIQYSADDVRLLLDTSLADSTVSETGSEDEQSSDIDSSTEYDLSDPEAGLRTEDELLQVEKKHFLQQSIIPAVIVMMVVKLQ